MTLSLRNVAFDCADPERVADFWAAAMGFSERKSSENEILIASPDWPFPRMFFQRVPEPKVVKNRCHICLNAADMEAEVVRLESLGATRVQRIDAVEPGEVTWTVMRDPEGNEFCVTQM